MSTERGRFLIEAAIGTGSTGTVYLARDTTDGDRRVAVKRVPLVDAATVDRLRHEADVLASVEHPNIVRVRSFIADGDGCTLVMEYAAGGSLAERLGAGPMAVADVVCVLASICDAVQAAHDRGVLHLDIKPQNILFSESGVPLLADFGVARRVSRPSLWGESVVGTAEYLDPDVADGAAPNELSDIYAIGVVGYECLAGRAPFEAATPLAVLRAASEGAVRPLSEAAPDVPERVAEVIERAMARRRIDRFPSAAALADALRTAAGEIGDFGERQAAPRPAGTLDFGPRPLSAGTRVAGVVRPAPPEPRNWRLVGLGAAAVVAMLAVVVAGVAFMAGRRGHGRARQAPVAAPARAVQVGPPPAPAVDCPVVAQPDAPPSGEVLTGHDASRCPIYAVWDGGAVTVVSASQPEAKYQLGEPGDQAVLGDWDCDGTTTLGLYRPDTGEAFVFDEWATTDQPATARSAGSGIRGGRAVVVQGKDGSRGGGLCDQLVVRGQ